MPQQKQEVSMEYAVAIRTGCGMVDGGRVLCLVSGCYRDPDIRQIGPHKHRTLVTHVINGVQLPVYILLEHRIGHRVWDMANITNLKSIQCIESLKHVFGQVSKGGTHSYKPIRTT